MRLAALCALLLAATAAAGGLETEYALETLELANISQETGDVRMARSTEGNPLRIGRRSFAHGLGTHANSAIRVDLNGQGARFRALVGPDAEVGPGKGTVTFSVLDGTRVLWESGLMRQGDEAKAVDVDISGMAQLTLLVEDGGDGNEGDHADWAECVVVMKEGKPAIVSAPREEAVRLTPPASTTPRINGARVFGVRPGRPFLFSIAATGERPVTFAADGLPAGLTLNPATGLITGQLAQAGTYRVILRVRNARGEAARELRIVAGEGIALTPPMGWNSWNCFAHTVTEQNIRDAADQFIQLGLQQHGWTYINLDDFWTVNPKSIDTTLHGPARDAAGRILPNSRFPDLKGLADYVHTRGLKIGLYSSPGPTTCGGCVGSFEHEEQDARAYAEWGFDFLKYDWCSYPHAVEVKTRADHLRPYERMRDALARQPRDIIYSLCQYGQEHVWEWGDQVGGHCWRTTPDIIDTWASMSGIGFGQAGLERFARPGNWNDPDMLVIGQVGWGPRLRPTRRTPNQQNTHLSRWCQLAAPLLIGCDLTSIDDFTLGLLTNDEVLDVNQDPLGRAAARVARAGSTEVWAKPMEDGSLAIGLFNRAEVPKLVTARWSDLGLTGPRILRDLWSQQDLGSFDQHYIIEVPRHGCLLLRARTP